MGKKEEEQAEESDPGSRGRRAKYVGHTIHRLKEENPRRVGTIGHHSWSLIEDGMLYEDYIKAGGRSQDLAWDIGKGHVEMKPPEGE